MGVCKIAVCHDCKCYVDLDKMHNCWEGSYWSGYDSIQSECYSAGHVQILVRFLVMHHRHDIEILYDNSDYYFDVLYVDGEVEKGKNFKEITMQDLADDTKGL